jgi:uncharacterized protein YbgA (DUF1722 family)/uncharacterized protein YbbK (DUF523 family)
MTDYSTPEWTQEKPRVGVSACLLGDNVRYNGGHKRDRFLTGTFGNYVEWVPVCPEVECGLPTPRPAMRLVGDPDDPRLVTSQEPQEDKTDQMKEWARGRLDELEQENLCGFIFMNNSPSSGLHRVKVYDQNGVPRKVGRGLWAAAFTERFPLLPVEDDGRLHDPVLRETFIEALFCMQRYRQFLQQDATVGGLVAFHTDHKMQLLAHGETTYREMGRLVANARQMERDELFRRYEALLMDALRQPATVRENANALMHMMGYFKEDLTADEKQELLQILEQYRAGFVPLIVPATLLRHYVRKYDEPYLKRQTYLNPHPVELQLRNHA